MATLTRLTSDSGIRGCPEVMSHDASTLVIQGREVHDPTLRPDPDETAVEIPAVLVIDAVCQLGGGMTMTDLGRMFPAISESMFRIETLDRYLVDDEIPELEHFARTGQVLASEEYVGDWMDMLRAHRTAGRTARRVHLVRLPLSDYLRWEFAFQAHSIEAGEDVRVVDLDEHPELADIDEDVWLFDDRVPVRMVYDDEGRLLYPERISNRAIHHIRDWRDRLWAAATPLADFMAGVS